MPGSSRTRRQNRTRRGPAARRWSVPATLTVLTAAAVTLSSRAALAATATPSPPGATPTTAPPDSSACDGLIGAAKDYCTKGDANAPAKGTNPTDTLDPLTSLAKGCANAASWTIDKLSAAVTKTTQVDFTNTAFLRQYAVVFAASTILTLILWLLAVAKRAVRGAPMTEALTEAVGFLWLTVLASAFTPLILYTVVSATDAVTDVVSSGTKSDTQVFFGSFSGALTKGTDIGGGPIMLIVVSMVSVLAAGVLWLELVIRAALLYVGALLGTAVYAGLVDKNMWHHVRRWAGIMIAVILVKPVIVIVLGLAGALSSSDDGPDAFSAVVSGLAIILLAIFASFMIYRFVPGFGDDVVSLRNSRKASGQSQAAAVISSPAALVKQGIKTHSARGGPQEQAQGGGPQPSNAVAGGMAAHSSRGGQSGGGAAAPPPRPGGGGQGGGGGLGSPFRANQGSNNGTQGGDRG
ncbi:hypothetical protein NMG29_26290 [Streptomyces cocklensis]|uniref:Integral membrane protein n=1 Tax=Actinacidiphila cocklensis TaxID=887465 RepID=A0A9W4GRB1_9ACTN|nr:hypothetical protein [Actinacidiphila cocklensis]MDD1061685.1 hypothetical protein [Actinacidiphila cocklensis]WSX77722.1 hypothetical protein OH826_30060 [Streptomyces sp. NBC_00899]CAG6392441.1 conserved membrane hypothetical protein [Actinacidiphila cocklensis]